MSENKCPECDKYWTTCPECDLIFCGSCGMTKDEAYEKGYFDEEEEDE